jgi:hypothetical protein
MQILSTLCNKYQQNAQFLHSHFNLIIESLTCFKYPSVHTQQDLYVRLHIIAFMHPYKQSSRWHDVFYKYIDISRCTV